MATSTNFVTKAYTFKKLVAVQDSITEAKVALVKLMNDPFFEMRRMAVEKIKYKRDKDGSILEKIESLASSDPSPRVRAEAISRLGDLKDKAYLSLFNNAANDSSFRVAGQAISALSEIDEQAALLLCGQYQQEKSYQILTAICDVYGNFGGQQYQDYFEEKLRVINGFTKHQLLYYYANLLTRMDKPVALRGIQYLKNVVTESGSNSLINSAGRGALKRVKKAFEEKKKTTEKQMAGSGDAIEKASLQALISEYDFIIDAAKE